MKELIRKYLDVEKNILVCQEHLKIKEDELNEFKNELKNKIKDSHKAIIVKTEEKTLCFIYNDYYDGLEIWECEEL
jgi:hypothetical protein